MRLPLLRLCNREHLCTTDLLQSTDDKHVIPHVLTLTNLISCGPHCTPAQRRLGGGLAAQMSPLLFPHQAAPPRLSTHSSFDSFHSNLCFPFVPSKSTELEWQCSSYAPNSMDPVRQNFGFPQSTHIPCSTLQSPAITEDMEELFLILSQHGLPLATGSFPSACRVLHLP